MCFLHFSSLGGAHYSYICITVHSSYSQHCLFAMVFTANLAMGKTPLCCYLSFVGTYHLNVTDAPLCNLPISPALFWDYKISGLRCCSFNFFCTYITPSTTIVCHLRVLCTWIYRKQSKCDHCLLVISHLNCMVFTHKRSHLAVCEELFLISLEFVLNSFTILLNVCKQQKAKNG